MMKENLFDIVNTELPDARLLLGPAITYQSDEAKVLALHGGSGCPREAKNEHGGDWGYAANVADYLYKNIYKEYIAFELKRQRQQHLLQAIDTVRL